MNHSLADRQALVCGASEGIGRASAIALAELGASVTVLAIPSLSRLRRFTGSSVASLASDSLGTVN